MKDKKTTLVLTYNNVEGYPAGVYESDNNKVIVHSQDTGRYEKSPDSRLAELLENLHEKVNLEKIDKVIVYAGVNALDGALGAATSLVHGNHDVQLVGCYCEVDQKRSFAYDRGIGFIQSECGGRETLQNVIDNLLKEDFRVFDSVDVIDGVKWA